MAPNLGLKVYKLSLLLSLFSYKVFFQVRIEPHQSAADSSIETHRVKTVRSKNHGAFTVQKQRLVPGSIESYVRNQRCSNLKKELDSILRSIRQDASSFWGLDMSLKQFAWKNVNTLGQELIRPISKTGNVQDYIKTCIDTSPALGQGMAYAAAMQWKHGQHFHPYIQNLMGGRKKKSCGQQGLMSLDIKEKNSFKNKNKKNEPQGLCPRCKKGKHWRNECKSKFHKDGTTLRNEETKKWNEGNVLCTKINKFKKKQNRETEERKNEINPLVPEFNILKLPRATPGSAGLDPGVNKDYLLSLYEEVQLVDIGFKERLSPGTFGLIIGKSSNYEKKI